MVGLLLSEQKQRRYEWGSKEEVVGGQKKRKEGKIEVRM